MNNIINVFIRAIKCCIAHHFIGFCVKSAINPVIWPFFDFLKQSPLFNMWSIFFRIHSICRTLDFINLKLVLFGVNWADKEVLISLCDFVSSFGF